MSSAEEQLADQIVFRRVRETTLRIALSGLLAVWCFQLVMPFIATGACAIIIAIATHPLYARTLPLVLGRGVGVPMPVILVGALGGMITSGVVGLFIGAVSLAVGFELLAAWSH